MNGLGLGDGRVYAEFMSYLIRCCLIAFACLVSGWAGARADVLVTVDRGNATVCPAFETDTAPPAQSREGCREVPVEDVDPQGVHIWVFFDLTMPERPEAGPLGLGVYAKASSQVFLNGALVGENGKPGGSRATEVPGRMDQIYPLPEGALNGGKNQIAIRLSSHAGLLRLSAPLHAVFVTSMTSPQAAALKQYWPSLLPFGAFVLGGFYFFVSALRQREAARPALLAIMSGAAAFQVLFEVSRGLWAYPYWFQDVRLVAIVACAALFSFSLAVYVILRFQPVLKMPLIGAAIALIAIAILLPAGFDAKTSFAFLASTLFSACVALSAIRTIGREAAAFAVCLLGFAAINFVGAGQFLDSYYYFVVAALLLFLFVQQAVAFAREAALRRSEEARADQLQYVLDQLKTAEEPSYIVITSAGRIHRIACNDIAYVQGSGDYVEVVMQNSDTHLHTATLADLEAQLPSTFLRVHRSYLVNSSKIVRLDRHPAGTGELILATGQSIPVSRRIMPKVKAALA